MTTQDLRERCYYLLTLFKAKNLALFEKYTAQLAKISAEKSTEFYHFLLGEYKKLIEGPTFYQSPLKSAAPKVTKTKPVKKAVKKITKKKTAKKVVKSSTKKAVKKTKTKRK